MGMDAHLPMAERLRAREMTSYFTAAGIKVDLTSGQQETVLPPEPVLSTDATLTALAQLGPLRLQCDRAFVSLIGRDWQYIIAECTPTMPYSQSKLQPTDRLCLGVSIIPCDLGICLNTIRCFTDETGRSAINNPNTTADRAKYRTRDLRQDPLFCERPYVTGWPHMRAYLEVPLRTATGLTIGSYCVVDSSLRDDFDNEKTVSIMAEIAQAIMDHLDLLKIRQQYERAERLIRGLDIFVDGCSSLRDSPPDGSNHTPGEGTPLNDGLTNVENEKPPSTSPTRSGSSKVYTATSSQSTGMSSNTDITTPLSSETNIDPFDLPGTPVARLNRGLQPQEDAPRSDPSSRKSSPQPSPRDAKMAFSRAANLIREATSIAGLVFLDACPTGFGALHKTHWPPEETAAPLLQDCDENITCEILGSSTGTYTTPNNQDYKISEALIQRLIHKYPGGRLFFADEHGPISSHTRPTSGRHVGKAEAKRRASKEETSEEIEQLFCIVPQSRSILFLPLWDYQKKSWYAATIGWTTDPLRSFEERDMTYIAAFSNSIMIEVARLDALVTSTAKGDFISSISHEFRSPLHGIMASAEILDEVLQDPEQKQLTSMMKSCATTLIDTTNHLLDFAKINRLVKDDRPQMHHASLPGPSDPSQGSSSITTLSSTVDLARLVEEVVEVAFIGSVSQGNLKQRGRFSATSPVLVTMDLESRDSWSLRTEPGAWRRIVMNIFGNALKYTAQGSIEVSLKTTKTSLSSSSHQTNISFSVKDSGCGMSMDYVKRQLFTPYAQENPLSAGVGLGLSIVQHIVRELGGTVNVESVPDVGTLMQVIIPTKANMELEAVVVQDEAEEKHRKSIQTLRGKTVFALDFDTTKDSLSRGQTLLHTLETMAKNWLQIDVLTPDPSAHIGFDVPVAELEMATAQRLQRADVGDVPLIVLCDSEPTAHQKQRSLFQNATFLVQPFGPRKLSWTVERAFACHKPRGSVSTMEPPARVEAGGDPSVSADLAGPMMNLAVATPFQEDKSFARVDKSPPTSSEKPHILAVDDNSVNLKILTMYMTKMNCTYATATNGFEAVQTFRATERPFDYIFMDISMPIMNGLEATREIRADERDKRRDSMVSRTRIVALTGLGSSSSQREAFTSGIDTYLMKPVSMKKLKELLLEKERA